MAHVGRTYKVLKRRDLCLNCRNYRRGLAEARIGSGHVQVAGTEIAVYTWPATLCAPITPLDSGDPIWVSNDITVEGKTFHIRLSLNQFQNVESWTDVVYQLRSGATTVYQRTCRSSLFGVCDGYLSAEFPVTPPEVFSKPFWGGDWQVDRVATRSARWGEWPL